MRREYQSSDDKNQHSRRLRKHESYGERETSTFELSDTGSFYIRELRHE